MNEQRKVIDDFTFEEVCLLVTFMRSDVKDKIIVQLNEMNFEDEGIGIIRDSILEKIKQLSKEELNQLLFDLPPNEFSYATDESDIIHIPDGEWK